MEVEEKVMKMEMGVDLWVEAEEEEETEEQKMVSRQLVYGHFVYDTSFTDIVHRHLIYYDFPC